VVITTIIIFDCIAIIVISYNLGSDKLSIYVDIVKFVVFIILLLTTTITTIILWPFVQDYPGKPVPEETFTHSHLS